MPSTIDQDVRYLVGAISDLLERDILSAYLHDQRNRSIVEEIQRRQREREPAVVQATPAVQATPVGVGRFHFADDDYPYDGVAARATSEAYTMGSFYAFANNTTYDIEDHALTVAHVPRRMLTLTD